MMQRNAARFGVVPPPLRGICLVVKNRQRRTDRRPPSRDPNRQLSEFPPRPQSQTLSESIPLFFIARNGNGLWVAREAEGRTGGLFLFKRSARRFADNNSASTGCATMCLGERLELDIDNHGGTLASWLDAGLRFAAHHLLHRAFAPGLVRAARANLVKGQRS